MNDNLMIGACDWRHKDWSGSFYPEELPADWCLGYYSNEFETVLVPAGSWRDDAGFQCAGWLDEANEAFLFFVELPPALCTSATGRSRFIEDINLLEGSLGGILLPAGTVEQGWLNEAIPEVSRLLQTDTGESYRCYTDVDRDACLLRLEHDLVDKRAARQLLEQALQSEGCGQAVACIFEARGLRATELSQMRQVIELMGL